MPSRKGPQIIQLPKFVDKRGNLSFVEQANHIPFDIARTYWIYDVPGGERRGGHAYRRNEEFVIALSGSFAIELSDGVEIKSYVLKRSYYGLYIPAGYWREMNDFSTNSLAVVLGSSPYDVDDYIRDYEEFIRYADSIREPGV